jgi:hypothetical protein
MIPLIWSSSKAKRAAPPGAPSETAPTTGNRPFQPFPAEQTRRRPEVHSSLWVRLDSDGGGSPVAVNRRAVPLVDWFAFSAAPRSLVRSASAGRARRAVRKGVVLPRVRRGLNNRHSLTWGDTAESDIALEAGLRGRRSERVNGGRASRAAVRAQCSDLGPEKTTRSWTRGTPSLEASHVARTRARSSGRDGQAERDNRTTQ